MPHLFGVDLKLKSLPLGNDVFLDPEFWYLDIRLHLNTVSSKTNFIILYPRSGNSALKQEQGKIYFPPKTLIQRFMILHS